MFKVGDRVKIINQPFGSIFEGVTGVVSSLPPPLPPLLDTRNVVTLDVPLSDTIGTGIGRVLYTAANFSDSELELFTLTPSQSAMSQYAYAQNLGPGLIRPISPFIAPASLDPTCTVQGHQWRPYMGLNEHYDFCETKGCEEKRPFTGKR